LRTRYPLFQSSSNITVIHLHYKSTVNIIDELIVKAKQTTRYVLDTESKNGKRKSQRALIQIQFVHSISQLTIILIETDYLPDPQSILFTRIEELCSSKNIHDKNLRSEFNYWKNNSKMHPEIERHDEIAGHISLDTLDASGDNDDMNDEEPNYNL
ncbi:unnamed protein product, partial [Rotaria magnacalcarata]